MNENQEEEALIDGSLPGFDFFGKINKIENMRLRIRECFCLNIKGLGIIIINRHFQ